MRAIAALIVLAGCLQPGRVPLTPKARTAESVFQVRVLVEGGDIRGTAWIVRTSPELTTLITAGHVCTHPGLLTVTSVDGTATVATVALIDPDKDLCKLEAFGYLGPALALAPAMPAYGTPVFYIGGPAGIWGGGMAPVHEGLYAGGRLVSIPTAPGASGSALIGPDGVFGVLVAVSRSYADATFITTLPDLLEFLR